MKKQYIAPKMTVIEVESQQLLAGSEVPVGDGTMNRPVGAPGRNRNYDDWFEDE